MKKNKRFELRKSPKQSRATATVQAILEASAHILDKRGEARLTTNSIAQRAGVSIGSLYQYFPHKDAILAELVRKKAESLAAAIKTASTEPNASIAIQQMIEIAVDQQLRRPRLAMALDVIEKRLPVDTQQATAEGIIAESVMAKLAELGIPPDLCQTAATDLFGMVRGISDTAANRGSTDNLHQRISWAVFGYLASARLVAE